MSYSNDNVEIPVWRVVSLAHDGDPSEEWCLVPNGKLCSTHWLRRTSFDPSRVRITSAVVPASEVQPLQAIPIIDQKVEKTSDVSGAKENMQPMANFGSQQEECSKHCLKGYRPNKRGILTINSELCNKSTTSWKRQKHMEMPLAKQNAGMNHKMGFPCVNPTVNMEISQIRLSEGGRKSSNLKNHLLRLDLVDAKDACHCEDRNSKEQNVSLSSCLFQTASGKAVQISNAGIKRATAFLGESFCLEFSKDKMNKGSMDSAGFKDGVSFCSEIDTDRMNTDVMDNKGSMDGSIQLDKKFGKDPSSAMGNGMIDGAVQDGSMNEGGLDTSMNERNAMAGAGCHSSCVKKDGSTGLPLPCEKIGSYACEGVIDNKGQISEEQVVMASSCLFQTAAGKAVSLSNAGMRRAMILLGGVRSDFEVNRNEMSIHGVGNRACLVMPVLDRKLSGDSCEGDTLNRSSEESNERESTNSFHAANGKTITTSNNSATKPMKFFDENKLSDPCGQLNISDKGGISGLNIRDVSSKCIETGVDPGLSTFPTDQRKFISISDSAKKHTVKPSVREKIILSESSPIASSCMTFMTRKGHSLSVSSSAIKRAKNLLVPDLDGYNCLMSDNLKNGGEANGQKLFQTAGGHLIKVSRGSIERAKLLLGESSPSNEFHGNETSNKKTQHTKQTMSSDYSKALGIVPNGIIKKLPAHKTEEIGSNAVNRRLQISRKLFKPPRRLQPVMTPKANLQPMESESQPSKVHFAQLVKIYPFQWKRKHRRSLQQFFITSPHKDQAVGLLQEEVRCMTAMTSKDHKFSSNVLGTGLIGSDEFRHMLIETGANPKFVSKEWVDNHFRWIVWKLASLERSYPTRMANKLLSVQNVFDELRYRYEREVNGVYRSALKKITEGDAQAGSMMVLCVAAIRFKDVDQPCSDAATVQIEITDGWYSLIGQLDEPLARHVSAGKIFVGQKLRICGASLNGFTTPMSPLEAYNSMKLALHINGTYRAHWAEKLGLCKGMPTPIAFHCIKNDGGLVPRTIIGIYRIYPILYYERLSGNRSITRTARAEEVAYRRYERRRNDIAEAAVLRMEGQTDLSIEGKGVEGAKLFHALETSAQPELLMADMSAAQLSAFAAYQTNREAAQMSLAEKNIQKALGEAHLDVREVTPLMKVSVMGLMLSSANKGNMENSTSEDQEQIMNSKEGILTMWQVTEEQVEHLKEGVAYCVSDLIPLGGSCNKSNRDAFHLRTTKFTRWRILPQVTFTSFCPRQAVEISSLNTIPFGSEFDVAVMVLHVGTPYAAGLYVKQWLFVSDGSKEDNVIKCSRMNTCLAINISAINDAFVAIEESLEGCIIGYCNLVKRHWDQKNCFWVADASDVSEFSTNFSSGKLSHLKNAAKKVDEWAKAYGEQFTELQRRIRDALRGKS